MEFKQVMRSHLRRDYLTPGTGNPVGPWSSPNNYATDTDLPISGSTPAYKTIILPEAKSTGVWMIVVTLYLDADSTSAYEQWKQRSVIAPMVTNNAADELTGHVWPAEVVIEIPEHTHTLGSRETSGTEGILVDDLASYTSQSDSMPFNTPNASRRTEQPVQLFFFVRMKTGDRCLIIRDPKGNTKWIAEAVRLAPAIITTGIDI